MLAARRQTVALYIHNICACCTSSLSATQKNTSLSLLEFLISLLLVEKAVNHNQKYRRRM